MENTNKKYCKICKENKDIDNFFIKDNKPSSYCKQCDMGRNKEWKINHPRETLIITTKSRCKKLGIPFNLTADDLAIPEYCPILGIKLEINRKMQDNSPSLDRVKPGLGYVKGNVNIISSRANRIKNDGTLEEHQKIVDYLLKHN
jgi:hypothetical protein